MISLIFGLIRVSFRREKAAMKSARILVSYEDLPVLALIAGALESQGHRVVVTKDARSCAAALAKNNFDLLILKFSKGPQASALLQRVKPQTRLIILSESPKLPEAAYQVEVASYIFLPCRAAEIWRRIADCMEKMSFRAGSPKGKIQLHPVNRRVYRKLISIFNEMTTSVMSLASQMELLQQKVKSRTDPELEDLCQQACQRKRELCKIMREIGDSFLRIKPLFNPEARKPPRFETIDPFMHH